MVTLLSLRQRRHWLSLLKVIAREIIYRSEIVTQALRATNEDVVDEIAENWTKTKG